MKGTKLVVLLVVIALVVSLLVGCSPKKTEGPPEVPAGAQNIKPPATVAAPADFAALAAQMAAKAKELKSWRAEIITERAEGGGTMKMSMKGEKIRIEDLSKPGKYQIVDMPGNLMLMVDVDKKTALEMKTGDAETQTIDPSEEIEGILAKDPNAKFSETELDGRKVWLIEYADGEGKNLSKSWIDQEWGLPLRTETTSGDKTEVVTWKVSDVNSVPDSDFEAPAGFKVLKVDMTDPSKMTPEQLKQLQEFMPN